MVAGAAVAVGVVLVESFSFFGKFGGAGGGGGGGGLFLFESIPVGSFLRFLIGGRRRRRFLGFGWLLFTLLSFLLIHVEWSLDWCFKK